MGNGGHYAVFECINDLLYPAKHVALDHTSFSEANQYQRYVPGPVRIQRGSRRVPEYLTATNIRTFAQIIVNLEDQLKVIKAGYDRGGIKSQSRRGSNFWKWSETTISQTLPAES